MVDQLNPSQQPSQSIETLSNPQRLDALLASGLPRTAQVVQINPQLPTTQNPAPANPAATTLATSPATSAGVASTATLTSPGTAISTSISTAITVPSANPTTGASPATGAATTPATNTASLPVTQAEVYKVQIRLEGRLYELLTTKPLDLGSRIQISRGGDQRITIQSLATATSQQPATAELPKPVAGNRGTQSQPQSIRVETPATSTYTPATLNTRPTGQPAEPPKPATSNPATHRVETPAASTYTPATLNSRPAGQPTAPAIAPENATNQPASSKPATPNTAIERVSVPLPKSELPIRMGPGERLNAEVLSSRPNPAPTMMQPPSSLAASLPTSAQPPHQAQPGAALKIDAGGYQIRIALPQGNTIEFTSPRLLPPGTQVQLVRDNQGQLWAELPTAQTRAIEQALREHLPQQQPPSALLNLLSSAQTSGQLQQAKPLLFSLFQILLGRSLTSPLQTDAASVKQQVQNSGTLLESKLAQNNTQNINLDHKAVLLKVTRNLSQGGQQRELPAALSERINALTQQALSRVLVNQITSLGTQTQEAANEQNRTLVLDIPIAWQGKTENLQLKIQRDQRGEDEETATMLYRWQVRLNFEVEERRMLEAELTLETDQISIIWSGDPELRQRIEAQLDQLQQRLESIGLRVKTLGVRELLPETGNTPKPPRSQLIDIKT